MGDGQNSGGGGEGRTKQVDQCAYEHRKAGTCGVYQSNLIFQSNGKPITTKEMALSQNPPQSLLVPVERAEQGGFAYQVRVRASNSKNFSSYDQNGSRGRRSFGHLNRSFGGEGGEKKGRLLEAVLT